MAKLELLSRTIYDADGVQTNWDFNFASGYLLPEHVKAYYELGNVRTQVTVAPAMLIGPNQLRIVPAVPAGAVLTIYRDTPKNAPLVDFVDRGTVSEVALDTVAKQAVFVAAEAVDSAATAATDVAVAAADVAQAKALEASASAVAAANSAVAAAGSAAGAASAVNAYKAELSANNGAALVGFTPAGSGAVATTVEAYLRALATVGNGVNVVAVDMPPYNGNLSAALDAATEGTVLVLGMRDYNIVGKYHSTAFTGPYVGNEVKHLKILGAGMPSVSADGTRFVSGSGTVVQGTLLNYADGFEAHNLGVDVGSYVNATYDFGGHYPEGFVPGIHKFQGTAADLTTYIKDVAFGNIKVLAVNNLNHAILCEFINGLTHGYCEAIGGFHGYVCKSTNVVGGNVWAYGQAGDSYIIKSDQYTHANNILINSITLGKRGYATRTAPGFFQSTAGGHITSSVSIGSISGFNCKELLTRIGDPEPITDIVVGRITGDDIQGNGFSIFGDMRRIQIGNHGISNATANGVYVDSNSGESIAIGSGVVTNSGSNGYFFTGPNHSHGDICAITNGGYGVNRNGTSRLDRHRVTGSGNTLGIINSLLEPLTSANLENSWASFVGPWPFQVVQIGSTLYFRGTVKDGTTNVIATLPVAYRPPFTLSFLTVAVTAGGTRAFAHVDVQPNGEIQVANFLGASPGLGGAGCIVALNFSYVL